MNNRFAKSASLVSATMFAALSLVGAARAAPSEVTVAESQQIARDAYVYAYSPVYAYRFLQDEVFNEKSISYIGDFNKIRSYQRLNTPDDTMFAPNVDTPYTRVWLDLRAEPVVLTLPKITPENLRYSGPIPNGVGRVVVSRPLVFDAKPSEFELTFSDPVHEFDTSDGDRGVSEPLKAKHRTQAKFDRSVILFNEVIQVF